MVFEVRTYMNVPDYGWFLDSCSIVDLRCCMALQLFSYKLLCLFWICIVSFIVAVRSDQRSKTSQLVNSKLFYCFPLGFC